MTKMKKSIYFCFIGICLFGCIYQSTDNKKDKLKFEEVFFISPIKISLDSLTLNHYERGYSTFKDSSTFYYIAYNRKTHCIDWFDLENDKFLFRTRLDNRGPNEIVEQADGIYVHSTDTIFINDGVFLYLIDKQGLVKQKIPNLFETESGLVSLVSNSTSPLGYLSQKNSLIGEAIIIGSHAEGETGVNFIELNLSTGKFFIHTLEAPLCFAKKHPEKQLNVYFKGDSIIYNPGCSSEIYVYNLETKENTAFKAKSSLSQNFVSEVKNNEPDALWKHFIENPKFFPIVFSAHDNLFYRLHWKEVKYQINSSTFSTAYDKPIILSVFDQNFKLISEFELPGNRYLVDFLILAPGGIILNASHVQNEAYDINTMVLHKIQFK